VVEAEEVQDRGVQVARVHDAVHGALAAGERVGALENPRERVVVALRDRVAVLVVAACARDREAEECARGDINLFVHAVEGEFQLLPTESA